MPAAEKISITLPRHMLDLIKRQVARGDYASTSEVIRAAMRLWQREEEEHAERIKVIRNRVNKSAASGAPVPMNAAFDKVERSLAKRVKTSR
ncbi:MAG: type II toxin-antitoxin system ParD family antitoxin [Parvularculaceae bacterium]